MQIERTRLIVSPNKRRVVLRPFDPTGDDRKLRIVARLATLSEAEVDSLLEQVWEEFRGRHQTPREFFLQRFEAMRHHLLTDTPLSENRRLLIGAYFTQEYAIEVRCIVQSFHCLASRSIRVSDRLAAIRVKPPSYRRGPHLIDHISLWRRGSWKQNRHR